jgi:DNA repair exonuclease SbcCD ATPase subunit
MIIFKKIRFKNILSTGNIFTEIDLNSFNNTLVIGINGSGKSTILDALTFVLFGKSFRHINKPQLLNSITKKNLLVEIEFSIGEINYTIKRGMVPVVFEIYQNEILLNASADNRDFQQFLEKNILRTNYKSFCQVVVLGSAVYKAFMRLEAAQKREIIEDLLDLEIFTMMNNIVKGRILENINNLNKVLDEKRKIEEKLKLLQEHIDFVNTHHEETIKVYEEDNLKLQNEMHFVMEDIKEKEILLHELDEKIKDEVPINEKFQKLSSYKNKMEVKIDNYKKENDFFITHDVCPTCSQEISTGFKLQLAEDRKLEIESIEIGLDMLNDKIEKLQVQIDEYGKIKVQMYDLKYEIQNLNAKLLSSNLQIVKNEEIILKLSKKDENVSENVIETTKLLEQVKIEYCDYEEEKILYNTLSVIFKDNGIKAKIIKQYIPIMNKYINKFLADLEFFGTFDLDENFKEIIKSRYRDNFTYQSFSQGERFRIDIALLFTWREIAKIRNSLSTNLLIMDEVFDSPLDDDGIYYLFNLLNSLKGTNIFIITPKGDSIIDKFEKVITFSKNNNFSSYE